MKILFVSGSNSRNSGGLYNSVRNLGQAMIQIPDANPTLLAHNDEYSEQDIPAYAPLPLESYKVVGPKGFALSTDITQVIEGFKPDIIHPQCIWIYPSYAVSRYSKRHNTPYIVSARGMLDKWILNNNAWKKKLVGGLYERDYLQNASCLNALAQSEYEAMREFGYTGPIATIPNGVNLPDIEPSYTYTLPVWKANDDRKVMLFLSRLHPKKGIDNLIQAWANIGSYKKEWKLIIAGESKDEKYLQTLMTLKSSLKLDNDVYLIGAQFHQQKDICFRCADAFILPSFSEGLPMAILEAWSYNLPVIMTPECNLPEGFENNAALCIEPDNESILATLKAFFSMTDQERLTMGKNGFDLVNNKFTWKSIAQQMHQVYKWILSGGPLPSSIRHD